MLSLAVAPRRSRLASLSLRALACCVTLAAGASLAHATPVTYQLTGNFTGTLGNNAFNGPLTFSLTSDTDDVVALGSYSINTAGTSTVSVDGQTATFTSPTFGVESEYVSAAFLDTDFNSFAVNTYNFDITPDALTGLTASYTGDYNSLLNGPTATSLGDLQITGATGPTTFSVQTAATPEPSTLALLGTGLVGVASTLRRRLRA